MVGFLEAASASRAGRAASTTGRSSRELGQRVARSLQEQHGNLHVGQMIRAVVRGAPGGMQRKTEEDQPRTPRQRRDGLRLRRHAAAERAAAGNERKLRQRRPASATAARTVGMASAGGWVASTLAPYTGTDSAGWRCAQRVRRRPPPWRVGHAGPRAMREHVAGESLWRRARDRRRHALRARSDARGGPVVIVRGGRVVTATGSSTRTSGSLTA